MYDVTLKADFPSGIHFQHLQKDKCLMISMTSLRDNHIQNNSININSNVKVMATP